MSQRQACKELEKEQQEKWGKILFSTDSLRYRHRKFHPGITKLLRKQDGRFASTRITTVNSSSISTCPSRYKDKERFLFFDEKGKFCSAKTPGARKLSIQPGKKVADKTYNLHHGNGLCHDRAWSGGELEAGPRSSGISECSWEVGETDSSTVAGISE